MFFLRYGKPNKVKSKFETTILDPEEYTAGLKSFSDRLKLLNKTPTRSN